MPPTPSASLKAEPCELSAAGKDSDEDLQADIENAQCAASLRQQVYGWQAWYEILTGK